MWEMDLVWMRSDRAGVPWSYRVVTGQMGIGTGECCHVPFVVNNNVSAADVVKAFPSFVTFALGWAMASQCSITVLFGLGIGDPCYWLTALLPMHGDGPLSHPSLLIWRPLLCLSAMKDKTHLYKETVPEALPLSPRRWSLRLRLEREMGSSGTRRRHRVQVREVWQVKCHELQLSNSNCCSKGRYIKKKTETGLLFMDQIISTLIRLALWHMVNQFSQVWATKVWCCFIGCIRSMCNSFTPQ